MSKGPRRSGEHPSRPPKERRVGAEEQALWQHVIRSIVRLPKAKPRVPEVEAAEAEPPAGPSPPRPPAPPPTPRERPGQRAPALEKPPPKQAPAPTRPAAGSPNWVKPTPHAAPRRVPPEEPGLPGFARRHARRIATGRIEIEARLDLHGLTQSTAHDRLVGFLTHASAAGLRTVLVITGKGGRSRFEDGERSETGVLRKNVPRWLAEPRLRGLVVSFGPAARHHGGEGAFYVQLRRPGR